MTATAKIFQNGQSQAVRLPKAFRFQNQSELLIKKVPNGVLLLSKDAPNPWGAMFDAADDFSDDFMSERMQPTQTREDLF